MLSVVSAYLQKTAYDLMMFGPKSTCENHMGFALQWKKITILGGLLVILSLASLRNRF